MLSKNAAALQRGLPLASENWPTTRTVSAAGSSCIARTPLPFVVGAQGVGVVSSSSETAPRWEREAPASVVKSPAT